MLHARVGDDVDESELEHAPELHRYARGLAFQVWEEGLKLRLHSANAPDTRLSPQERGFSHVQSGGRAWRVHSSLDRKARVLVQVAEERRSRDRIAGSVAGALLLPMIVGLPVLGLLIWLALRSGLKPLVALGRDVAVRDPDNLQLLEAADVPREVGPLVASLNGLFGRLRQSIDHERRFSGDAAHELRTPLAGARAQAEVALGASADAERTQIVQEQARLRDNLARVPANSDLQRRYLATLDKQETDLEAITKRRADAEKGVEAAREALRSYVAQLG